jgi:hypothetical protein
MGLGLGLGLGIGGGGVAARPQFDANRWRQVFDRLAERLPAPTQMHITVIGGVAMTLGYGARRTTLDADVVMTPEVALEVLPIALLIAPEFGLAPDWLNQKAMEEGLIVRPGEAGQGHGRIVFDKPTLTLEVPPTERMLGMKLASFSRGGTDVEDAKALLALLLKSGAYTDADQVWDLVGGLIPAAKRDKSQEALHTLWEVLHEST